MRFQGRLSNELGLLSVIAAAHSRLLQNDRLGECGNLIGERLVVTLQEKMQRLVAGNR
ncbi:hypothetical protein D3C86_2160160 [compost metagenome]